MNVEACFGSLTENSGAARPSETSIGELVIETDGPFTTQTRHGTVVLNFRRLPKRDFGAYAEAFQRAGRSLALDLAQATGYRDTDACPIVFLYRHALELNLKAVGLIGRDLLSLDGKELPNASRLLKTHKLSELWPAMVATFTHVGWSWKINDSEFNSAATVRKFLREFELIDPLSHSFRYPVGKTGQGSLPHHFSFNVLEFARRAEALLDLLSGAVMGLEVEWERAAEEAHNRQQGGPDAVEEEDV